MSDKLYISYVPMVMLLHFSAVTKLIVNLQLERASSAEELRHLASRNRCLLVDVGFTQSVDLIEFSIKQSIIRSLSLHHLLRSKAELDQYKEGLDCLRVLDSMKAKPELMKSYFMTPPVFLTAGN